jgi:hypothetical protein
MGRYTYTNRKLLEETIRLTIYDIIKSGILKNDCLNLTFLDLNHDPSIQLKVEAYENNNNSFSLDIKYNWKSQPREMTLDMTSLSCNFGGKRHYLLCPMTQKKVTALYLSKDGFFASRDHLQLIYRLSRSHRGIFEELDKSNNCKQHAEEYRLCGHPRKAEIKEMKAEEYKKIAVHKLGIYFWNKNEIIKKKLANLEQRNRTFSN